MREASEQARQLYFQGYWLVYDGRHEEAERFYQQALANQEKAVGADPEDLIRTVESYADLLRRLNRDTEEEAMEGRASAPRPGVLA